MGKPSKDYAVPLWEKANLTVYEAAAYSGIGADMYKLFAMLEMKYDFKLSKNGEMEETR